MWTPEFSLRPSAGLSLLILLTHGAVLLALQQLGGVLMWLAPLVLISAGFHLLRDGLRRLPHSIEQVWLADDGWHWRQRNGQQAGPFTLHSLSRVDARFIRLSFSRPRHWPRHLLLTAGTIGPESFRQLQVFLRWAGDKNQPLGR